MHMMYIKTICHTYLGAWSARYRADCIIPQLGVSRSQMFDVAYTQDLGVGVRQKGKKRTLHGNRRNDYLGGRLSVSYA